MIKNIFTPFLFTLLLSVGAAAPMQARTAVDLIDQEFQTASISVVGNVLHVLGAEDELLSIYNVTGVRVMSVKVDGSDKRYTLNLPKGCYIVKVGKLVRKVSIR
ncbi:MAG: T9SS type A sorting domain-containing protein [Prevotella fusca]|uniref:T9SS type A sorting domain-containing protein n=1 Tax=Prevotella fusca TaxID=589436 RepID=UPI003F9EE7C1